MVAGSATRCKKGKRLEEGGNAPDRLDLVLFKKKHHDAQLQKGKIGPRKK